MNAETVPVVSTLVRGEGGSPPATANRAAARRGMTQLRARFAHRKLGEILASAGLLDEAGIARVLELQQRTGILFGEACARLALVEPAEIERALASQFGFLHAWSSTAPVPSPDLVMARNPFGAYGEALREIAGRLGTRLVASGHNALAVTSAGSGDGRSHVAANLAVCFAQAGWRTLLIDADLRAPRQHEIFSVSQHPGLSRLLCGHAPEGVRQEPTGLPNLSLITSGPLPPNPLDLLGREELSIFLRWCRDRRDIVVIDTPSSARHADTELIASAAGCALVVATGHRSRLSAVQTLVKKLRENDVEVMGSVLNSR